MTTAAPKAPISDANVIGKAVDGQKTASSKPKKEFDSRKFVKGTYDAYKPLADDESYGEGYVEGYPVIAFAEGSTQDDE